MRIAVHTDFEYHATDTGVHGEHAFTLFFVALASRVDRLVVLGRLDPAGGRPRYPLGDRVTFVGLPFYRSLWRVRESAGAMLTALRRFWTVLDEVDAVWLLGPHPVQLGFAALAAVRRRRIVLGVRQEFPRYIASRHPRRLDLRAIAVLLEVAWRMLARFLPVVVVGPALARRYRGAADLLEVTASLVSEADVVAPEAALERRYDGALRLLSVGRIENEKNPLLLAEILARLRERDPRWELTVIGEGPVLEALAERLDELGVREAAELAGYVPYGPDLLRRYRESQLLIHVSWTEGLPQVLIEAFAAGLPAVATDVGGIRRAVGRSALLVPPGDARAAADAAIDLARDPSLRRRLVTSAHGYVAGRTIEAESARVARFLGAGSSA